jgi:hypothetical protein
MSSWFHFVPYRRDWRTSVRIEIDRQFVARNVISSKDVAARQNTAGAHLHERMPQIEVAHIGRCHERHSNELFHLAKATANCTPSGC